MNLVILYVASAVIFLGLDAVGLRFIVKPAFEKQLGDWLLDSPRYGPAVVFYLFYVAGLLYFVSWPAVTGDWSVGRMFLVGAFFGAVAYGTYEFSNLATLGRWTWGMVGIDLVWGTLLTGVTAAAGVWIARAFE
ncbi:DUF2177 family protein [Wenxinia marina]|uniref:Putative membrane protein n=1 Tax=Wenxinia marina DSM 24838 TaxID=1123501 RepID=A0A0D0NH66_9RHOB|nr:DUF2177 family protein [Wenxinia marina]KIQ67660.1 putative membrane protein [Wenxinia marina DSM 24838]GGL79921.1 hypothetical protein GCM10011392_38060 [Wenxinia marina]